MKKYPIIVAALALPATAVAGGGPFDLAGSVVQTVASLALVIGIILIIYHFAGRLMKLPQGSAPNRYIRVLETRHLSPKKSLLLVEVGGEYLLLSNSGEGVNFLSKLELLEEIEVVEEKGGAASLIPARLKERLSGMLQELPLTVIKKNGGLA